jgi:hypothetical protein
MVTSLLAQPQGDQTVALGVYWLSSPEIGSAVRDTSLHVEGELEMALGTTIREIHARGARRSRRVLWGGAAAAMTVGLGGPQPLHAPRARGAQAALWMAAHGTQREPTYTLAVPTRELVDLVRGQVFTDSGRFFPCRTNPSCSAWGQDIALSAPNITIDGPRLVFSVHLVGSYAVSQFFAATVTGDLIVSGLPTVRGRKVVLTQSAASASSASDVTFRAFLEATHGRIESMLDQSPGFDLAQYLAYAASDPALPPPRLPNTPCVDPSQIQVQSISTQPTTSTVSAVVSVTPPTAGSKCA